MGDYDAFIRSFLMPCFEVGLLPLENEFITESSGLEVFEANQEHAHDIPSYIEVTDSQGVSWTHNLPLTEYPEVVTSSWQ